MKLTDPTSFQVLRVIADGRPQTATNLGEILDQDARYMSNQLNDLHKTGLVRRVGVAETSRMFEITEKGRIALEYADKYSHQRASEFGELVERVLDSRQVGAPKPDLPSSTLYMTPEDFQLLQELAEEEERSLSELTERADRGPSIIEAGLNRLEAYKLVNKEDSEKYTLTRFGALARDNQDVYEKSGAEDFSNVVTKELLLEERKN